MKSLIIPIIVLLLVVPVMFYQAMTPNPTLTDAPAITLSDIEGFRAEALPPGEAELKTLPKDTIIKKKRYYNSLTGDWFVVNVVIGGTSKGSIHRPELCLPSQGFQMVRPRNIQVVGRPYHMLDLEKGYGLPLGFAYTFFNQEGYATCSHMARIFRDVLDRSLLNRYDRWVMVTINSARASDEAMTQFLTKLEDVIWKK